MSAPPSLSVIVTCHERGPALAITLASVADQRFVQPQVLVAEHRAGEAPAVALNAALVSAQGDWVLFLAAGDRVVGDVLLNEALHWMQRTEAGVAAGEMAYDSGRIVKLRAKVNPLARDFVPRAATFYRRSLFAENGDFEVSLHAMAAYELHLRLWKNRVRFKPLPLRIAAAPAAPSFDWRACREEIRVRHLYFPVWRCGWWDARSLLRCLLSR
jgi:glycosyltransferase involved in cell wall biosynthesis